MKSGELRILDFGFRGSDGRITHSWIGLYQKPFTLDPEKVGMGVTVDGSLLESGRGRHCGRCEIDVPERPVRQADEHSYHESSPAHCQN